MVHESIRVSCSRRRPNLKNRMPVATETAILAMALELPAYRQVRVSNELRKAGVVISAHGVRSVWLRHNLKTMKLRLKALEEKVAKEGVILTESQLAAPGRANDEKEAHGARPSTLATSAHKTRSM